MMHDIFQHLNLSQTEARNLVERVEQVLCNFLSLIFIMLNIDLLK